MIRSRANADDYAMGSQAGATLNILWDSRLGEWEGCGALDPGVPQDIFLILGIPPVRESFVGQHFNFVNGVFSANYLAIGSSENWKLRGPTLHCEVFLNLMQVPL